MNHSRVILFASSAYVLSASSMAQVAADAPVTFSIASPVLDRWNYPFNQSPGVRPTASVWGAFVDDELSPDFDNRDAQMHIAFDTGDDVQQGLGTIAYTVTSARITVTVADHNTFTYDATFDPWQSYLSEADAEFVADDTPGRPAELFGVGFRNGFDALSYQETTSYSPIGPMGKGHRTTFAMDLPGGQLRDVSNNIDDRFETQPFALGQTDAVQPGELVPSGTVFTFDIDVNDPYIHAYLQESLDAGIAHFMIASLFPASADFTGAFPQWYCKEHPLVIKGLVNAASLEMTVIVSADPGNIGDLNGDGTVNVSDLLLLLAVWGECPDGQSCAADLNSDGTVNVSDLLILLANWG